MAVVCAVVAFSRLRFANIREYLQSDIGAERVTVPSIDLCATRRHFATENIYVDFRVMRTFSLVVLLAFAGCSTAPVTATAAQACGFSATVRWQQLSMTEDESQRFLSLVKSVDALQFGPRRAEAWFSNGFDEIVLCQYRIRANAPCDAELLTVHFLNANGVWSAGPVEHEICVE